MITSIEKMTRKLTQEEFLQRCKSVHGDKYDYSEAIYNGKDKKVTIICKLHGNFLQTPHNHIVGCQNCPTCGNITNKLVRQTPIEVLLSKFKQIHEEIYDYSKIEYKGTHEKIVIICNIHGEFMQTPHDHLEGRGCIQCGIMKSSSTRTRTTELVVEEFTKIHGNRYDYSYINYTVGEKCNIVCKLHGVFLQQANAHIKGQGCPTCGRLDARNSTMLSENEIIQRFQIVHDNKYTYPDLDYTGQHNYIKIMCEKHGIFQQTPHGHSKGQGCPKCSYRISRPQLEWLNYMSVKYHRIDQEIRIGSAIVDGLCGNIVFEYNGCYFHGCNICYKDQSIENKKCKKTMKQLFDGTLTRKLLIESAGYKVIDVWDHEWKHGKKAVIKLQRAFRAKHC